MSDQPSSLREAVEDRLTTHSRGEALDELSILFGIPRPVGFDEVSWRNALWVAAYGPRGQPGGIQAFLERVLAQWNEEVEVEIRPSRGKTPRPPSRTRIYSLDHSFVQADVGRLIRIDGFGLFLSVGPVTVRSSNLSPWAGAWLDLAPVGGSAWDMARFDVDRITTATAKILPFVITEVGPANDTNGRVGGGVPCRVNVWIYGTRLGATPPHYLQPSGVKRTDVVFSNPSGTTVLGTKAGHGLVHGSTVTVTGTSRGDGDYPITNVDVNTFSLDGAVWATFNGDDNTGDVMPAGALPRSALTGSPEGGELMRDIAHLASRSGPWPFYISGDGLRSLRTTLERLVASGVTVRVYRARVLPSWLPDQFNRRTT